MPIARQKHIFSHLSDCLKFFCFYIPFARLDIFFYSDVRASSVHPFGPCFGTFSAAIHSNELELVIHDLHINKRECHFSFYFH
jgi:hypothetical protein